jgi:predicted dehydrogenase
VLQFARESRQLAGVELVGVAEPDAETGQAAAAALETDYYADYSRLLAATRPVCVAISPVNSEKAAVIGLAAQHGVHVIVDKPAATSTAELDAITASVGRSGIHLSMLLTERYAPRIVALKRAIAEGCLGPIVSYSAVRPYAFAPRLPAWFQRIELEGGPFVDLAVHDFDLLRWFSGTEIIEVVARQQTGKYTGWPGFIDTAHAQVTLADGSCASIVTNWLVPDGGVQYAELTVFGRDGMAWLPGSALRLLGSGLPEPAMLACILTRAGGTVEQRQAPDAGGMRQLAAEFFAALAAGREPPITTGDTLAATRVSLAARRSAETGTAQPVDVPHA